MEGSRFVKDSFGWHDQRFEAQERIMALQFGGMEKRLERIEALGGARGPVLAGPDGRSARAGDPDGNTLLLIELAPHAQDRGLAALAHPDALQRVAAAQANA